MASDGKQPLWPLLIASICRFAAGCGVFQVVKQSDGTERFIDPATNSTKLQLSTLPARLMGRQVIGRLKRRDYTKNDGTAAHSVELSYGRGVSAIDAPSNINVPINEAVAAAAGYRKALPPQAAPAPAPAPAPAAAATATVAKPAAAKPTAKAAAAAPNVPPARPAQQTLPMQTPVSSVAAVAEADPYGDY